MHEAILVNADLSGATLDFAELNGAQLMKAELSGSNMSNAKLNPDTTLTPPVSNGASLEGAHLKNVNLSGAQLTGANFKDASFYGQNQLPKDSRACTISNGFTVGCATAAGAKALGTEGEITDFSDAFLFAVDFGGATLVDVDFSNAVLVDSSFLGASPTSPNAAGFSSAHIQGADLGGATGISFQNAYVDFSPKGNVMHVLLNGDHTQFRGWGKPGDDVCVEVGYDGPTKVPDGSTIKCPNDGLAGPCGPTTKENGRWASGTPIENASPPAWYVFHAATYTDPAPDPPQNCISKEEAW
jgi:uncharacterized protein YjbI with pentapeptide repeats